METVVIVILVLAVAILGYSLWRERDEGGAASRSTGLSDKEMASRKRIWTARLKRIHAAGRLFVIPPEQNNPRSVRRYEKRAPLDVKVHRFRLEATANNPVYEINAIEFTTSQSLAIYERRIAAKGLEPNAADTVLSN